jgi:hypothetical protein
MWFGFPYSIRSVFGCAICISRFHSKFRDMEITIFHRAFIIISFLHYCQLYSNVDFILAYRKIGGVLPDLRDDGYTQFGGVPGLYNCKSSDDQRIFFFSISSSLSVSAVPNNLTNKYNIGFDVIDIFYCSIFLYYNK